MAFGGAVADKIKSMNLPQKYIGNQAVYKEFAAFVNSEYNKTRTKIEEKEIYKDLEENLNAKQFFNYQRAEMLDFKVYHTTGTSDVKNYTRKDFIQKLEEAQKIGYYNS